MQGHGKDTNGPERTRTGTKGHKSTQTVLKRTQKDTKRHKKDAKRHKTTPTTRGTITGDLS